MQTIGYIIIITIHLYIILRAKSISQLKSKIETFRNYLYDINKFKEIYDFSFTLFKDRATSHNVMEIGMANSIIILLLINNAPK